MDEQDREQTLRTSEYTELALSDGFITKESLEQILSLYGSSKTEALSLSLHQKSKCGSSPKCKQPKCISMLILCLYCVH